LQYMSPEHLQGKPVTAQSDIFALGCVLYELVAGRAPALIGAEPSTQDLIGWNQMSRVPPRLDKLCPHVPVPVANAIQHMIAKEPANRPLCMQQVARELKTLQSRYTRMLTDPPRDLWRSNLPPRHVTAIAPELPVNTTEPDSNCGYFEDSEPAAFNQNSAQKTEPLPLLTPAPASTLNEDSTPVGGVLRPGASQAVPGRRSIRAQWAGAVMHLAITARRASSLVPRMAARWWAVAALFGVTIGVGLVYGRRYLLTSTRTLASSSATAPASRARGMARSGMTAASRQDRTFTPALVASARPSTTTVSVASLPSASARERPSPIKPTGAGSSASKPPTRKSKRDVPEPPFKLDDIVF
jgi:hypothetical protein